MNQLLTFLQSIPVPADWVISLLKASLFLGLAQLFVLASPSVAASTKHLMLTVAMTGFLLIPLFALVVPGWKLRILPPVSAGVARPYDSVKSAPVVSEPLRDSSSVPIRGDESPALSNVEDDSPAATSITVTAPAATPVAAPAKAPIRWSQVALYVWLTVSLLLVLRLALGMLRVWWITRTGEPLSARARLLFDEASDRLDLRRSVRMIRSPLVHVPMIWGFHRPALLLPMQAESWPEEQLQVVLLHELGHLKRWDFFTLVISNLVTSFFWFQPQVWFADLSARRECERACDDLVLNTGTRASDYAAHLLSIVKLIPEVERFGSVTLAMSRRSELEGRLLAILHPAMRRSSTSRRSVAMATAASIALVIPLSSLQLAAAPTPERNAPAVAQVKERSQKVEASDSESDIALASNHMKKEEWKNDAQHSAEEWYQRAYSLHSADRYDEAIAAFKKAIDGGYRADSAMYNIACGYSLMNDRENALIWLRRSLDAGFDRVDHLFQDSDLDPLRSDARFQSLIATYRADFERERAENPDFKIEKGEKGFRFSFNEENGDRQQQARAMLEALRSSGSKDGHEWSDAGVRFLRLRELDIAIDALQRAVSSLGEHGSTALYNLACAYALKGDTAMALDTLEKSINEGFDNPMKLKNDPDINAIRGSSRFPALVQLNDDLSLWRKEWNKSDGGHKDSTRDWQPAIDHFRAYVQTHAQSGRAWYNLGYALHVSGAHKEAIDAFQTSLRLGYRRGGSAYNVACALAMMGQKDGAFEWLNRAEQAGFDIENYVLNDDDLDSLRDDARLQPWIERAEQKRGAHEWKHEKSKRSTRTKTEVRTGYSYYFDDNTV